MKYNGVPGFPDPVFLVDPHFRRSSTRGAFQTLWLLDSTVSVNHCFDQIQTPKHAEKGIPVEMFEHILDDFF